MRTWHPKSYSQQVRTKTDSLVLSIKEGYLTEEEAVQQIADSWRNSLIKNRTAKRLGRLLKKGI